MHIKPLKQKYGPNLCGSTFVYGNVFQCISLNKYVTNNKGKAILTL